MVSLLYWVGDSSQGHCYPIWGATGLRASPLLFNICVNLLEGVMRWFGMTYNQNSDDTQLYITTPVQPGDAMEVTTRSLEAMWYWMDHNRLKLNPSKIQLLFVDDRSGLVPVPRLAQDWVVFLWRSRSVIGILLDSQLLLKMLVWPGWVGDMLWLMPQFAGILV